MCGGPGAKAVSAHDRPQLIHPTTAHECDEGPARIAVETGAFHTPADVSYCNATVETALHIRSVKQCVMACQGGPTSV